MKKKGKGLGRETNILLSQNVKVSYDTWKTGLGSNNVLLIGGTGEGKSRNTIKPNVYSLPCDPRNGRAMSMIFTDPKGELYRDCAGFLAANGYRIKVFNLIDMKCSDCYNPFRYITSADSLMVMVDSIVTNANGGQTPKDPHWTNSAKSLLNSICYYVFYEYPFAEQNFKKVSHILNKCGSSEDEDNYESEYDKMINVLRDKKCPGMDEHPAVTWHDKVTAKGQEMASIISTAQTAVRVFASQDITRLTDVDTMELETIGDVPTAVFLIIPTTNDTYNFLISMAYTQMFESLYYRAQNVYHGSLPHHVIFWLDEFANVGKIPSFDRKIATFRSVNISAVIVVQSPNQIETLYEKANQDIIDNVHQVVFIGSGGIGDKSAPAWMSKALGQKTIQSEQTSVRPSKGGINLLGLDDTTIEHSYSATQRNLLTQDEIYRLSPNECLVLIKGQKPFRDKKIDINQCLNFSSDLFSKEGPHGRELREEYVWEPHGDLAKRRTVESYREGLMNAAKIDEERQALRERDEAEAKLYEEMAAEQIGRAKEEVEAALGSAEQNTPPAGQAPAEVQDAPNHATHVETEDIDAEKAERLAEGEPCGGYLSTEATEENLWGDDE